MLACELFIFKLLKVGWQEKQVCGSEAMVAGMGCHTVALCAG